MFRLLLSTKGESYDQSEQDMNVFLKKAQLPTDEISVYTR
jgi:hypothetical protein